MTACVTFRRRMAARSSVNDVPTLRSVNPLIVTSDAVTRMISP